MSVPNHIVFTTIFHPDLLWDYHSNLEQHGHLGDTCVWVVGDRKTPTTVPELCHAVTERGLKTTYLDCAWQEDWSLRHPELAARLPWNNETRRNIGYLHALQQGCIRLISIDDDNWPTLDDFIGGHQRTGGVWTGPQISEPTGFHNVCAHLVLEPKRVVFPRGYPFRLRGTLNQVNPSGPPEAATSNQSPTSAGTPRVGVTAGLWLNEPDIDATTWLNGRVEARGYCGPDAFALNQDTWSPINTQNTSVIRDLIPAYLCIPMGWDVPGGKIQRYGDIWGGYFLQAVLAGTPWLVTFGRPLVDHRRNPHDYVDDLRHEFWGMVLTDWLLVSLRQRFRPTASSVCDRVLQLADFLQCQAVPEMPTWCPIEMRRFVTQTADNLKIWSGICRASM
jgi:hypothetical protein